VILLADNPDVQLSCVSFSGLWSQHNDVVTYRETIFSNGLRIDEISDRILELNAGLARFQSTADGEKFVRFRADKRVVSCP
jgi:hypothetical protein